MLLFYFSHCLNRYIQKAQISRLFIYLFIYFIYLFYFFLFIYYYLSILCNGKFYHQKHIPKGSSEISSLSFVAKVEDCRANADISLKLRGGGLVTEIVLRFIERIFANALERILEFAVSKACLLTLFWVLQF